MSLDTIDIHAIARELRAAPPVKFDLDGASAFNVLATFQLALRHPSFVDSAPASMVLQLARAIQAHFEKHAPAAAELARQGWDPRYDN